MKVMVIVKATKLSESGTLPTEQDFSAMTAYNEELVKAGIMLAGEGLHPSSKGKRVVFKNGAAKQVIDGPFAETKELIAGFWLWQVKNMDEALAWAKRCPDPMPGEEAVLELRQIHEGEDLGEGFTKELQAREEAMRKQIESRNN